MWKPALCPACQSPKIGLRSLGGEKIAADLADIFPTASIGTIAKGTISHTADILVATEYFWSNVYEPFHTYSFGVVAEILADIGFTAGQYTSAENTARKMARLLHFAKRENATCIMQTVARDRLLSLLGARYAYEQESLARSKYSLPPFGVIVTFTNCTPTDLPDAIASQIATRTDGLVAKIDHETFLTWQKLFPTLPDSIKIHIAQ